MKASRKGNHMGLIKAALGSGGGVLGDQWREYFYCDSMKPDVLACKGQKRTDSKRSSNSKGTDNVITNGAVIAVNEGQAMMIVDQGKIVEFTAEAGEFTWDSSSQPSIFYGDLGEGIKASFDQFVRRFGFGGDAGSDQRVYFFNLKEIYGNKYGTTSPVPFRIVDANVGLDLDASVRCNGEYSYKMVDPILFYVNICGNVEEPYTRDELDSQMKSELLAALQPAFAKISAMGIRYSAVPGHTQEVCDALDQELSAKWTQLRGLKIVSFGCNSITLSEEDEKRIKQLQTAAAIGGGDIGKGFMTEKYGTAMETAAGNEAGAMMGFMGLGMAANAMGSAGAGFAAGNGGQVMQSQYPVAANGGFAQQQPQGMPQASGPQGDPAASGWACACGATNTGKFCSNCGAPKPEPVAQGAWTCECGAKNTGKFCSECGKPAPKASAFKCSKCGWEPEDPANPPKFCPECGDAFDEDDRI